MAKVAFPLDGIHSGAGGQMGFGAGGFIPPAPPSSAPIVPASVPASAPSAVVVDSGPQITPQSVAPQPLAVTKNQVDTADPVGSSIFSSAGSVARDTALENTLMSQAFAREQMRFQQAQNAKAMEFSAEQAKLNRDFQERMSNTSHQREVQDLIKAGLNPVLSALGGASTPSGSAASGVTSSGAAGTVDTSANALLSSVLNALIGQETAISVAEVQKSAALESANINARTQKSINDALMENQRYLAREYPQGTGGVISSARHSINEKIEEAKNVLYGDYNTGSKVRYLLGAPLESLHRKR